MNALELADALDRRVPVFDGVPIITYAAAELRRLHKVNQELLEALKSSLTVLELDGNDNGMAGKMSRAAIKKATGGQA